MKSKFNCYISQTLPLIICIFYLIFQCSGYHLPSFLQSSPKYMSTHTHTPVMSTVIPNSGLRAEDPGSDLDHFRSKDEQQWFSPSPSSQVDRGGHKQLPSEKEWEEWANQMSPSAQGLFSTYAEQNVTLEDLGLNVETLNQTMRHKVNSILVSKIQDTKYLEQVRAELIAEAGYPPSVDVWAQGARMSVAELSQRLAEGRRAKQLLVLVNRPVLEFVANKYRRSSTGSRDILQEAAMGLLHAAELYNPKEGAVFLTYAIHFVRACAFQALAQHERTVRLPMQVFRDVNKYQLVAKDMEAGLDSTPSVEAVAERMGLAESSVKKIRQATKSSLISSVDYVLPNDTPLKDLVKDPGPGEKVSEVAVEFKLSAYQLLSHLEPRERDMVMMKFGFGTGKKVPLKTIAKTFGVSTQRAKRTIERALAKLRDHAQECQALKDYPFYQDRSDLPDGQNSLKDIGLGEEFLR